MTIPSKYLDARARMAKSIEQAAARIPDPMVRIVFGWLGDQALALNDLRRELHALRAELKEPPVAWKGVWKAGDHSYKAGNFVTHRGALWHCNATGTTRKPGASDDWTLAVKSAGR